MATGSTTIRSRILGAAGAAAVQLLIGYALVFGLRVPTIVVGQDADSLLSFTVPPPSPPPPPVPPPAQKDDRAEGAAAPPNIESDATEIEAPKPKIEPPEPPPVVVAPDARTGPDPSQGATDKPGPGTGAGGEGNGTGSGGQGNGKGAGGGTPASYVAGDLRYDDLPGAILRDGLQGTVEMRLTIDATGRVTDCAITRSSGSKRLDDATCRLAERDLRYRPKRDASGRPVPTTVPASQDWYLYDRRGHRLRPDG